MGEIATIKPDRSLVAKMADRFSVDPQKFMTTLKATAFKQRDGSAPSDEQMMALMVVADQYKLNPFTREIYAFPDKQNGIVPVVGVDGWSRIINEHPQFDGAEFRYSDETVEPGDERFPGLKHTAHEWIECVLYRKDRNHPVVVREYLDEVYRPPFTGNGKNGPYTVDGPWQTHTRRFHRHKTLIQCSRIAFGFAGIFDHDEAERIIEAQDMGAAAVVEPEAPKALPHYPQDQFTANLPKWHDLIRAGRKTADDIIATVETKGALTAEQKEQIREAEDAETTEGEQQ